MTPLLWAILGSAVLGGLQLLVPLLPAFRGKARRSWLSVTSGASLAFVMLHLERELLVKGSPPIHAVVPLGPDPISSLLVVQLASLAAFHLAGVHGTERPASSFERVIPYACYGLAIGGVLPGEEGFGGWVDLVLLVATIGPHLGLMAIPLVESAPAGKKVPRLAMLALAPLIGCMLAAFIKLPGGVFYLLLALVSGATLLDTLRTELPEAKESHPMFFAAGSGVVVALVLFHWWQP